MGDLEKAKVEQLRQRLRGCVQRMSDKARELWDLRPAVRNGSRPVVVNSGNPVEQRLNDARNKLDHIYYRAMSCGNLAIAVRAVWESLQIERPERHGRGDLEQQTARMNALPPGGIPLSGRPVGPPLTEEGRKVLEEVRNLSAVGRMLMREGYTAMIRISELEARARKQGRMYDLLRDRSPEEKMQRLDHGPQEASGKGKEGQYS